jgi:hypothetical protein
VQRLLQKGGRWIASLPLAMTERQCDIVIARSEATKQSSKYVQRLLEKGERWIASLPFAMTEKAVRHRHCEEQSDAAIAMTRGPHRVERGYLH